MTKEEAIKHLEDMKKGLFLWDMTELIDLCISALSENKGEWIHILDSYYEDGSERESHWECSKCGSSKSGWGEFKFCPDCGADMREPKGEKGIE